MAKPLRAVGSSMGARVLSGESVYLFPSRAGDLRVGDVVAFVGRDGSVVAHRLVRIEPGPRFVTRRDGPGAPDPLWGPDALVGVVSRDGRLGRWIARWPRLAIPLGAALRIERLWDLPSAVLAAAIALTIQVVHWRIVGKRSSHVASPRNKLSARAAEEWECPNRT